YVADSPGDTLPDLCDHSAGWEFMSHDDGCCVLAGGCPQPTTFDVVDAASVGFGAEVVADYHLDQGGPYPAGVAYAHPTTGYRTVNLGFGIEYMRESTGPGGHFVTGIYDRVDLLGNILEYFGVPPDSIPTSVPDELAQAAFSSVYPNPCREAATVAYRISRGGRATVTVYDVAGHLIRTLLDERLLAGASGELTWDRRDEQGRQCGSGIYFFRIDAPGMTNVRKVVVLR
ncbi:T9SS type A sorting domain-containing protein, partial [bacterium]|nr:T9SS type A sorting domain-containing protein [bacterium]